MSGRRPTTVHDRAIDTGVRCALWPSGDARDGCGRTPRPATSCAFADRSARAARAAQAVAVATPLAKGSVRVRGQVCLRTPAPDPSGSLPQHQSLREG